MAVRCRSCDFVIDLATVIGAGQSFFCPKCGVKSDSAEAIFTGLFGSPDWHDLFAKRSRPAKTVEAASTTTMIRFRCDRCGKRLKSPLGTEGRKARCRCGATCRVPGGEDVSAQPFPPPIRNPAVRPQSPVRHAISATPGYDDVETVNPRLETTPAVVRLAPLWQCYFAVAVGILACALFKGILSLLLHNAHIPIPILVPLSLVLNLVAIGMIRVAKIVVGPPATQSYFAEALVLALTCLSGILQFGAGGVMLLGDSRSLGDAIDVAFLFAGAAVCLGGLIFPIWFERRPLVRSDGTREIDS